MGSQGITINSKTILSTGNIMSINDITKKPSQNSTQEVSDFFFAPSILIELWVTVNWRY